MALVPSPENAAEIAGLVPPFVRENYGVVLDYGVESLSHVDRVIEDLRRDQRFETLQTMLFAMGCYVGEVMVRQAGASWRTTAQMGMGEVASSPIVIRVADGRGCNPVGRVYKRFQSGAGHSLVSFYHAMTRVPPGKLG